MEAAIQPARPGGCKSKARQEDQDHTGALTAQTYDYDALGRLVRERLTDGGQRAYGYDRSGNRTSIGSPQALVESNDSAGAVQLSSGWSLQSHGAASGNAEHATSTVGSEATITFTGSAVRILHGRTTTGGRLDAVLDPGTGQPQSLGMLDQCSPSSDPPGGLRQLSHTFSGFTPGTHTLRLRMVASTCQGTSSTVVTLDAFQAFTETTSASHDADNRLRQTIAQGVPTDFSYDPNGANISLGSQGVTTQRTLDALGRMLSHTTRGVRGPFTYTYWADGIRKGKTTPTHSTSSVQTSTGLGQVLQATTTPNGGSATTTSFIPGLTKYDPTQATEVDKWAYQHNDAGSHREQTNGSAQVKGRQTYDAWGQKLTDSSSGQDPGDFGWATEQRDAETGLMYLPVSRLGGEGMVTTVAAWLQFLHEISSTLLQYVEIVEWLPEEAVNSGWLCYPGATEEQIKTLESRLGVTLPPSYRTFLKASNGFRTIDAWEQSLFASEEVDWYRTRHQDLIDAWIMGEGSDRLPVSDADSFNYGPTQDTIMVRSEYLQGMLQVSDYPPGVYLLNPAIVNTDGDWEAWYFDPGLPGASRSPTFYELIQKRFRSQSIWRGLTRR